MKKLTYCLFISTLFLSSCDKINNDYNPKSVILTIKTGDTYEICYQKLQDLHKTNQIKNHLCVQNEGFQSIENYNSMIPLYSEFLIVDKGNNNYGDSITFSFNKDTLKSISNINEISILTGGSTVLEEWPDNIVSLNTIKRGDTKDEVFDKLIILKTEKELENRLNRIIYTIKDLNTSYDPNSANSVLWNVIESYDTKKQKQYYFNIHFADNVVNNIEIKELEVRALN